jgi:hypothetical protein
MSKPTHGKGDNRRDNFSAFQKSSYWDKKDPKAPYGRCPTCDEPGVFRERRPDGYDTCFNGHKYKSSDSITK